MRRDLEPLDGQTYFSEVFITFLFHSVHDHETRRMKERRNDYMKP